MSTMTTQELIDNGIIAVEETDERHATVIVAPDPSGEFPCMARYIVEEHLVAASFNLRSGRSARNVRWYAYEESPDGRRGDQVGAYAGHASKDEAIRAVVDECSGTLAVLGFRIG